MSAACQATAAPESFSARLVADFARDGFVVVRSFFNAFQVESMQQRLDAYVREVVPRLPKVWIALDPVDEENGCVRYVPGSHLQPGDVLVHHAMTIHRADGNTSDRHRRALGAVYFSRRSVQDAERLAAYQKTLER